MGYYIDLSLINLEAYKAKLIAGYMIPSRMILKERTDERFNYFKSIGIKNLQELHQLLKKKGKFEELSKVECFKGEYLSILLRELNSIHPKPNKISDFIGISNETINKLEKAKITNTEKLYEKVLTSESRKTLAKTLNISEAEILELTQLTDLSRIKWVGSTFARMLYDIGIDSVEKASKASFEEIHKKINQINKEKNYFKGQIGLNDMKLLVEAAKDLKQEISYT